MKEKKNGFFSSFSSIIKTMLIGLLIYGFVLGCLIFFFSNTVGILIEVSGLFMIGIIAIFAGVGYLYSRKSGVKVQGKKLGKYPIILAVALMLITSQVILGFIILQPNTHVIVGVTWDYNEEDLGDIPAVMSHMQQDGFSALRIPYQGDYVQYPGNNFSGNDMYQKTNLMYASLASYKMDAMLICPTNPNANFVKYIQTWGTKIFIYQLSNELDLLNYTNFKTYMPYTREELESVVQSLQFSITQNLPANQAFQTIVTFSSVFPARVDLLLPGTGINGFQQIASHVNYVGYDSYLEEGAAVRPFEVNYLRSLTQKPIWITEVGSCTVDDSKQANYIVNALNYARLNGVERVYVAYWIKTGQTNDIGSHYRINDRLAEQSIMNWIQTHAN